MIRKFTYRPPLELLVSGFLGVLVGIMFVCMENYHTYDWIFLPKAALAIFGFITGVRFIVAYFQLRKSGHITVSDTFIQLPQYLLKPRQIDFSDIIFVSERDVADGIIKISSNKGFDLIKRRFMIPAEFDELVVILKANTKA